jgi:crotonobetainyl-CoA:carnitine CoA-transferase CaiB-like acyl-CoA transferase
MLLPKYDCELTRPVANRYVVADSLAVAHALIGIRVALFSRTHTGRGEHTDVTMHGCHAPCHGV